LSPFPGSRGWKATLAEAVRFPSSFEPPAGRRALSTGLLISRASAKKGGSAHRKAERPGERVQCRPALMQYSLSIHLDAAQILSSRRRGHARLCGKHCRSRSMAKFARTPFLLLIPWLGACVRAESECAERNWRLYLLKQRQRLRLN